MNNEYNIVDMDVKFLLKYIIKKQLLVMSVFLISISTNCFLIISNNNKNADNCIYKVSNNIVNAINAGNKDLLEVISKQVSDSANLVQNNRSIQREAPESCDDCYDKYFAFYIQSAFYHSKPFLYLLESVGMTQDDYLNEIAKVGVATTEELQIEFVLKMLPLIKASNFIKVENNILAKWIQLRSYDQNVEAQLSLLTQQVSTQNFNNAIQTIATLPEEMQVMLQKWHEKVKSYVYAKESLKVYLEQHD